MWVPMNDDLELELQCGSSSGDMLLWKPWSWKFLHASERLSIRSMHLGSLMKTDTCHFSSSHLTLYTFKIWPWKEKPAVKLSCLREFSCVALTGQIFFFSPSTLKEKSEALQCWAETHIGGPLMVVHSRLLEGSLRPTTLIYFTVRVAGSPFHIHPSQTGSPELLVLWTHTGWLIGTFLLMEQLIKETFIRHHSLQMSDAEE